MFKIRNRGKGGIINTTYQDSDESKKPHDKKAAQKLIAEMKKDTKKNTKETK